MLSSPTPFFVDWVTPWTAVTYVAVAAGSYVVYRLVVAPRLSPLNRLPGPPPTSLVFGNALDVGSIVTKWSTNARFPDPYVSFMKQFGGAVHYRLLLEERVQFTDPKAVQHILATHAPQFPRDGSARLFFEDLFGGVGLFSSEGSLHDKQRKWLNPHFTSLQVKSAIAAFYAHAQRVAASVLDDAAKTNSVLSINKVFQRLALNLIGETAFGYDFDADPIAHDAYEHLLAKPTVLMGVCMLNIPHFTKLPLPWLTKRNRARDALHQIIRNVVVQGSSSCNLLDMMLEAKMDMQEALVHTMTFVSAGHETTSTALCWVFATLAAHPVVYATVRSECQHVLGTFHGLDVYDVLGELTYTTAVIQETVRLNPPAPFLSRRVAADDSVVPLSDGSDVFIPKGTSVVIVPAAMHRDPQYWDRPDEFVPERFVDGSPAFLNDCARRGTHSHAFHYMPFGAGAKSCIGQRFAMAELQVVVATFAAQFEFSLSATANINHSFNTVTAFPAKLDMAVRRCEVLAVAAAASS
ncbi:Aste57867_23929 [Aphanomyces stellatus]|uniref:Aste57867_23929 protein n=1 Tax=Aphanomyces stellatus TaxID=120398 RepID=A0A485LQV5_9STRA|nr:hypothetical protein As57867_023856 [Aphanomyces stellatus]VFU00572.1 Aste57867_23929 [Aphanomyces stellatus]